jgi:hypothetical protein
MVYTRTKKRRKDEGQMRGSTKRGHLMDGQIEGGHLAEG